MGTVLHHWARNNAIERTEEFLGALAPPAITKDRFKHLINDTDCDGRT
eukprot:gene4801-15100_t